MPPSSAVAPPPTAAKRSPWLLGGGIAAVIAVAVAIAFASAAFVARLDNPSGAEQQSAASPAPADASSAAPAPASPSPSPAAPAPPSAVTPSPSSEPTSAPAAAQPPSAPTPGNAVTRPAAPPTPAPPTPPADPKGAVAGNKPPTKVGPTAPVTSAPARAAAEAQQRLDIAKAKVANNLNEPALADLRAIVAEYATTPAAAEASLLTADLLEKMNRIDDAMAALVEFDSRFAGDRRVADTKLRRALMLGRTRQPKADLVARALLNEVVRDFPGTPQSLQALAIKMKVETDRREIKEMDPVLKTEVPAIMVTLRSIVEQFPTHPQSIVAYNRLATMYADMNRWAEAAQVLEGLGANYQGNPMEVWFRLGDIYERRLNDAAKAKEAYAKVPKDSPRFGDAQRRLRR